MNNMSSFLITLGTAIALIILGYLIKYKKWSFLIAGYNTSSKEEKEKYDEDALCRAIGNLLFLLGGITFLSSLGSLFKISWVINFSWALFSLITIAFVIYANVGNKFKK